METTKYFCDRCKKEIKGELISYIIDLIRTTWYQPIDITFNSHIELCKGCLKDFEKFMKLGKIKIKKNKE